MVAALGVNLAACAPNASGRIDYAGTTVLGAFDRRATVAYCHARFASDSDVRGMFILNPHRFVFGHGRASISFEGAVAAPRRSVITSEEPAPDARGEGRADGDGETLTFGTESGLERTFDRRQCSRFDIRKWLDDDKRLHVAVDIDCTADRVRVRGTAQSEGCDYLPP
jgi:hypothetical protein